MTTHNAEFLAHVRTRKQVRGPRGDFIRWVRWHGSDPRSIPPLRNRYDLRRWISDAQDDGFCAIGERLWIEFTRELGEAERKAARALDDLEADSRSLEWKRAVVKAWARTFGGRTVTAAQLCRAPAVREAICRGRGGAAAVAHSVAVYVRQMILGGPLGLAWAIERLPDDGHKKVARWRLVPTVADDELPDPTA